MILIVALIALVAIVALCWLLFTLATFALPAVAGFSLALWAYHAGAGMLGAAVAGWITSVLTLVLGQSLLVAMRPVWVRAAIVLIYAAPAALAGYHATHGIVQYALPSHAWQTAFSMLGAVAVGCTAAVRFAHPWLVTPIDQQRLRRHG